MGVFQEKRSCFKRVSSIYNPAPGRHRLLKDKTGGISFSHSAGSLLSKADRSYCIRLSDPEEAALREDLLFFFLGKIFQRII